jgi:thiamine biosynthesis lipoprotein
MDNFTFSGLGTAWSISADGTSLDDETKQAILLYVQTFENRFSRFIPSSEVNAFRTARAGEYPISRELAVLLHGAQKLRALTNGAYDPAIGELIEHTGYDASYTMVAKQAQVDTFQLPAWSLQGTALTIDGPVVFDLGGIGKGYCIDRLSDLLVKRGYSYFIVEGGGDMYGTTKVGGQGFRVALEWPGRPDTAFGIVELKHQGLAVSDSFKRRYGQWHHIIDPRTKEPIKDVIGCATLAPSAWQADQMTSGLFLAPPRAYAGLSEALASEYVVFQDAGQVRVSQHWPGELF